MADQSRATPASDSGLCRVRNRIPGEGRMRTKLWAAVVALAELGLVPVGARASVLVGHSGWYLGNPLPQGNTISSVDFAGTRGYAAVAFCTLLRLSANGAKWSAITTDMPRDLAAVDAV